MKKLLSILSLFGMIITLGVTSPVYAMEKDENEAIEVVSEYVERNTEGFADNEKTPIDTIYFSVDKDGEISIVSGEMSTLKLVEDVIIGSYTFYDDGLKGVNHYYEVQMKATVIDKSDYFTYSSLSVKPKNNASYLSASTAKYASYLRKTSISDAKQYYYAGSTPSDPYVYVKSSFTVNGDTDYSIPERKQTNPIK